MNAFVMKLMVVLCVGALAGCGSSNDPTPGPGTGGGTGGGGTGGGGTGGGGTGGGGTGGGTTGGGGGGGGETTTKKEYGAQCEKSADCKSDFCVFLSGGSSLGMCTQTCEDDIDCPGLDSKCVALSDAPQKVCVPK
ncbi:MAG: hypothetical protein ACXWP4_15505 [Polyangiales bacterium]